jgi:hypothetical protein
MADYGIGRTGGSLRDALNALYPMTGMGEYNTMFPPQTGSPQPSGPVPMPPPRPQMPPQLPPGALGMAPPGYGGPPQGLPPGVGMPPGGLAGPPGLPGGIPGQANLGMRPGMGRNFAAELGLRRF